MTDAAPVPVHQPGAVVHPPLPGTEPLPAWLQPRYPMPQVAVLGYSWPRGARFERGFWGFALLGCLFALSLATFYLSPDTRGIGTHEQLGLPPCGFVKAFDGAPCPSCGYTTTFTLAAHGRPIDAFTNQPFGFLVFILTLIAVPFTALSLFRGVSLFGITERWPWVRIFVGLVALWLAAWGYKWVALTG